MDIYSTVNQMKANHQTIFDLSIRVTYYARVSTTRFEQDGSIEHQIEFFENMIAEHPNWIYVNGYVDRIRGESAKNRASFMQMIEDSKHDKFDLVLTKEVSRFARNTVDSLTYTRELLRNGVGVLFQNDNICTVDSDAEFRLTIMSSIAQDEVRKLSERIKFGHKQSIQKGVVMGNSRIYGYDKDNGKLVINEKEAEMVRLIFDLYSTGKYSLRSLEKLLYEKGYRSRAGNKISHTTLDAIIRNPKYKGYYCGNKVKIADYRTKEQVFLDEKDWVMWKDETGEIVPAIVDEVIWQKANSFRIPRSEEIKARRTNGKTPSVLSGKVICGQHGTQFWRNSYSNRLHRDGNIYQWICREKKRGVSADCKTFAIYEYELYDILKRFFVSMVDNVDEIIDEFIKVYKKYDDSANLKKEIKKLKGKLTNVEGKKSRLLELYIDESVSKKDFQFQNEKLDKDIDDLKLQISSLDNQLQSTEGVEGELIRVKNILKGLLDKDSELTKDDIDVLVINLVQKIVVSPIDKNSMAINIILADNSDNKYKFTREKGRRSFGNITLMMCPKANTINSTYCTKRIRANVVYDIKYTITFDIAV